MDVLSAARKELEEALGSATNQYLKNLKLWFHVKISKECFDARSRALLPDNRVHLHNTFLLALLSKCQLSDSVLERPRVVSSHSGAHPSSSSVQSASYIDDVHTTDSSPFARRFKPADPCPVSTPSVGSTTSLSGSTTCGTSAGSHPPPQLVQRQRVLADRALVHGRLCVTAWQLGLDTVTDAAVDLLLLALHQCLKNVLTTILSKTSGYQLRHNRQMFNIGRPAVNPWLQACGDTLHRRHLQHGHDTGEADAQDSEYACLLRAACGVQRDRQLGVVTLWHVRYALSSNHSSIPCHAIYTQLMESVSARLEYTDPQPQLSTHQTAMCLQQPYRGCLEVAE